MSQSRRARRLGGLTAAVLAGALLTVAPLGLQANALAGGTGAGTGGGRMDPQAMARKAASSLIAQRLPALKIGRHDGFVAKPVLRSAGLSYVAYDRTYRGLPVIGGDFVVVTDAAGHVLNTSVAQTSKTRVSSITPTVGRDRAVAVARQQVSKASAAEAPRLVVFQGTTSHLAWETSVRGRDHGHPSYQSVYVDARTGKYLASKEHVLAGTGNTAYAGTVSFPTTLSGSTYSMKNSSAPTLVCQDAATNTTFSGTDDVWGNGVATSRETGCADAFYAADQERLMLSSWLGRNGMNGSGGWVPIRVGLNDVNAYYDGTQVQVGHTQTGGKWIGSIDVVAHEFGHGIDDTTPGGISGGGTQEFVADTFGAATEAFANNPNDPADYTVGEEVNLVGSGPIRYMYNPSLAGDANCYSSSTPNDEVHSAAGPGNHWFYLLAEGTNPTNGQPTSPTCNSTTLTGVGIQNAQKIMYNAMLMKTSTSSYLKYRTWTLTSAKNLDATCGLYNKVKAAWNAVSVPAQTADPTCGSTGGVTVTNPGSKSGTVGTAITSFTLSASGGTSPYTWSATGLPPGITIGSTTGTVSGTPTTAGTYNVTATATGSGGSGSGSTSFTFTIGGTGGGCSGQKLGNPGFETGTAAPWTSSAGVIDNTASQPARSGSWKAWLDGYGTTHTDTLSQSVTIPSGCGATLSFYLHIDSAETTTTTQYDKLTVKIGSTTLATYSNLNKASGYTLRSFNVSSFAGQTVTVSFSGTEDSSLQTSFVIDDTALNLS
ncbi:M4 family metallopeptidase [Nocardioides islandensis]|uniref:M4 family metallopeptidase n=1 Tax=Nocardioides islandensis TaxID=433663 RepID=A0A930YDK8_9ACTN|nr:M4 family metallopeptidase [Nocardioides islandensis]MBF4764366.1 M4 family metallopeptidase [Nocardioides islandensis]